jgi:tape measure domain-containing protein
MANVNITVALQGMQAVQSGLATVTKQLGAIQKQTAPGVTALGSQFRAMGVQAGYAAQGLAAAQVRMAAVPRAAVATGTAVQGMQVRFAALQAGLGRVGASLSGLGSSFARFQQRALVSAAFFGLIGVAIRNLVGGLLQTADAYTMLQARLQIVSKDAAENATHLQAIYKIAQDARVPLEAVGKTYQRIALNGARLGITQGQVAQITSTLSKALTLSGATAEEAANGMIQLTQAMSKGKLDGDELRSVFENMPLVVAEMEKATGRTRGELYKLASQGKITAEVLLGSLLKAGVSVDAAFSKMPRTFGQAATQLSNAWEMMMGKANDGQSAINGFTASMDILRDLISDPAFAAAMANFLGFLGTVAVKAATAFKSMFDPAAVIHNQKIFISSLEATHAALLRESQSWAEGSGVKERYNAELEESQKQIDLAKAKLDELTLAQNVNNISMRVGVSHRDSYNASLAASKAKSFETGIPAAKDREAESRARNLQIMTLENQGLQETIDGNYEEARALQDKVAIMREGTDGADAATAAQIRLNSQLVFGATVAESLKGPYEQYIETLGKLQAAQAAGVISAQQMAQAQVMAAATAISPWLNVADTVGQAFQTMFGESKAVSIAMAIINTLQGITTAIATYPPPLSYAMAAAQAALGFAQVAKIQSTQPGASTASAGKASSSAKSKKMATGGIVPGFGGGDVVPAMLTPGEFVINKHSSASHRGLLQQINANRFASGGLVGRSSGGGAGMVSVVEQHFYSPVALDNISMGRFAQTIQAEHVKTSRRRYGKRR